MGFDGEEVEAEVLIIGAGAAGLRTAIEVADRGRDVLVLGKRSHGDAHTVWAAGGINASLGSRDPEDRWDIHAADTLEEGHAINDPQAVEMLCWGAPDRVRELDDWGCDFARTEDGDIQQRYFGAQSYRRTCFVGDRTGRAILETLVDQARERDISYRDWVMVTDVLADGGRASGALGYDMREERWVLFRARAVVVAAGGHASVYRRSSSRPEENNGDGAALCLRAGASLRDMEMVQFHPTGMVGFDEYEGRLVTEAVRGEGGRLFNTEGERFMEKYSPEQMELDARDVVARAIHSEVEAGRGTDDGGVWLDITHRDREFLEDRLPRMVERFDELGVDISEEPMEVAPTTHYAMGGVSVDFTTMSTGVEGLYCVGESTAGVHGANRLGGNSLCETVVFGKVCGEHVADFVTHVPDEPLDDERVVERVDYWETIREREGGSDPLEAADRLRETMWEKVGVVRMPDLLEEAIEALVEVRGELAGLGAGGDVDLFEWAVDLHFMVEAAEGVTRAARRRVESRGGHYRDDFPERDDERWLCNLLITRDSDGALQLEERDVPPLRRSMRRAFVEEEHALDYHHLE